MDWEQFGVYHAKLNDLSVRNDWAVIEEFFFKLAQELSGPNIARMIRSTNLLAKTVIAFGKAAGTLAPSELAICVGYHDQHTKTRIRESSISS